MFDLARALRRIKPQAFTTSPARRLAAELPFITDGSSAGPALVLDTCVYIDILQGHSPTAVDAIIQRRTVHHLSVCVAELTHLFGRLDPRHPGTRTVLREIEGTIRDIPAHRVQAASLAVVAEAGILAGLLCRLRGLPRGQEGAALNDATLFLHALANGLVVLTRNVRDFDLMNQILPSGRVLFYDAIG